jgi:hypothetical protein
MPTITFIITLGYDITKMKDWKKIDYEKLGITTCPGS